LFEVKRLKSETRTWILELKISFSKLRKQKSKVDILKFPPHIRGSHLGISPILPPSIRKKKNSLPTLNGPTRPHLQKGQG
jgi:hypothetical protein